MQGQHRPEGRDRVADGPRADRREGLAFFAGLWIVGIVGFIVARVVRSRQGLPMDVALKELPPE